MDFKKWLRSLSIDDTKEKISSRESHRSTRCASCSQKVFFPQNRPPFGTGIVCSECYASLLPVNEPLERPYCTPQIVKAFFGYSECSLAHLKCPRCQKTNYSIVFPEHGHEFAWYVNEKQENPRAAFVVSVTCVYCKESFVVEWDESPFQVNSADPFYIAEEFFSKKNFEKAVIHYTIASENGNAEAMHALGAMYSAGLGVKKDINTARRLYERAAKLGHSGAQQNLGGIYYKGKGVEQNFQEAVRWFRMSAEGGNIASQANLGVFYLYGKGGLVQNYEKALGWCLSAAKSGDAQSQNNVGMIFHNGLGVEQNFQEAIKWYTLAADQGDLYAHCNLAKMYFHGMGVKKDYKMAADLFSVAAEGGHLGGQVGIADCYLNGLGREKDLELAQVWLNKAAEQGNEWAIQELMRLKENLADRSTQVDTQLPAKRLAAIFAIMETELANSHELCEQLLDVKSSKLNNKPRRFFTDTRTVCKFTCIKPESNTPVLPAISRIQGARGTDADVNLIEEFTDILLCQAPGLSETKEVQFDQFIFAGLSGTVVLIFEKDKTVQPSPILRCKQCGVEFDLSSGAVMVTLEDALQRFRQFGATVVEHESQAENPSPDLIALGGQQSEFQSISSSVLDCLQAGKYRRWRCNECDFVQGYPGSFFCKAT